LKVSAELMSGFAAPLRTKTPTPTFAMLTRLPATTLKQRRTLHVREAPGEHFSVAKSGVRDNRCCMEKLACTSPKIIFVVDTKDVRNLEMAQHTDEVRPHRGSTESADALCRHEDIGVRRTSAKLFLCFRIGQFKLCGSFTPPLFVNSVALVRGSSPLGRAR
jgi:hypothetical protein